MTNYSAWDSKAEALLKEAEEDDKHQEAQSSQALGLEGGPKGPPTVKAEAEMDEMGGHSKKRQDFIEWSNSREVTLTHGPQEDHIELAGPDMEGKAIRLSGSEGVTYVVPSGVVKVMVDNCRGVCIRILATIMTSHVELYGCADVDVEVSQPLGTLQVDECISPVRVRYAERDHIGSIYHQNSPGLSIGWGGSGCEVHIIGSSRAVQLCTQLNAEGARDLLLTGAVQRDEAEYPVDMGARQQQQPEPEAAPALEERRQLAEQRRQAGNDMFRANDFMQAAVHYTESLQLDPAVGTVWANRAQCWLKLGDHDKALADAVQCTEVEPANPKGWFRKGMSLHAMKRFPEAIPALLEAEKLEPQNKQVVEAIRMAQMMARKSAAVA